MSKPAQFKSFDETIDDLKNILSDLNPNPDNNTDNNNIDFDLIEEKGVFVLKNMPIEELNKSNILYIHGAQYGIILEVGSRVLYDENFDSKRKKVMLTLMKTVLERENLLEKDYYITPNPKYIKYFLNLPFDIILQIMDKNLLNDTAFKEISKNIFDVPDITIDMILYFHEHIRDNFDEKEFIDNIKMDTVNRLFEIDESEIKAYLENICSNYNIKSYIKRNLVGRNITNERMITICESLINL